MMITTSTTIGFKLPDEYEEMQEFLRTNDMSEWKEIVSTQVISYRKEGIYFTNIKKGEGNGEDTELPT